jgi:hypothetical protein
MKKTLLIAAATLAMGVINTRATDPVHSQNIVGYINQVIPANRYQIIGSQMIGGSDVGQTNGDVNVTLSQGVYSCQIPLNANPGTTPGATNSQLLYWTGSGYSATYYWFNSNDASSWFGDAPGTDPAGWYDALQNYASINLTNGAACFIKNVAAIPLTNTVVGNVFQGTNQVVSIKPGYNLINLLPSIAPTNLCAGNGALPSTLTSHTYALNATPSESLSDSVLLWTGTGFSARYYYFSSDDASAWFGDAPGTDPAGFYDSLQNYMPDVPANPQVNQGFFLKHVGSTILWTNSFVVP